MKNYIHYFFAVILLMSSCSVTETTKTTHVTDIKGVGVIQKPVIADLEVKQTKVQGTSNGKGKSVEYLKNLAIIDAVTKASADVLVEPNFTITKKARTVTVDVSGWPANYKNFRSMEKDDAELLKAGTDQKAEVVKPVDTKRTAKTFGWIMLSLGILAGFIGLGISEL